MVKLSAVYPAASQSNRQPRRMGKRHNSSTRYPNKESHSSSR